jgi:hypothetical protein
MQVPWATITGSRHWPAPYFHCAIAAFREPAIGSSLMSLDGAMLRTSNWHSGPEACAPQRRERLGKHGSLAVIAAFALKNAMTGKP